MSTVYPLHANKNDKNCLIPTHTMNTEESISTLYDLWLREYLVENGNDRMLRRYRLCAKHPHNIEMALAYDIKCPHCGSALKQTGRMLNSTELGEYTCKTCDQRR